MTDEPGQDAPDRRALVSAFAGHVSSAGARTGARILTAVLVAALLTCPAKADTSARRSGASWPGSSVIGFPLRSVRGCLVVPARWRPGAVASHVAALPSAAISPLPAVAADGVRLQPVQQTAPLDDAQVAAYREGRDYVTGSPVLARAHPDRGVYPVPAGHNTRLIYIPLPAGQSRARSAQPLAPHLPGAVVFPRAPGSRWTRSAASSAGTGNSPRSR
jgi:hypothetical protein